MKTYCYITSDTGLVTPVCLCNDDTDDIIFYNYKIGKINFDSCKVGDKIKLFNTEKFEGIFIIDKISSKDDVKKISFKQIKEESLEENFLSKNLSTQRTVLQFQAEQIKKSIDDSTYELQCLQENLSITLNSIKNIEDYAKQNNVELLDVQIKEVEVYEDE